MFSDTFLKYLFLLLVIYLNRLNCDSDISLKVSNNLRLQKICFLPQFSESEEQKSCVCQINDVLLPEVPESLQIDCSFREFDETTFNKSLPSNAATLDLSWNQFRQLPPLSSLTLSFLDVNHNNISYLNDKIFENLPKLTEINLSWNLIQKIAMDTFKWTTNLQILDLSHNQFRPKYNESALFHPLNKLNTLKLSSNNLEYLNNNSLNYTINLYQYFGINLNVNELHLRDCQLNTINLPSNAKLEKLDLRKNSFSQIPAQLPFSSLEIIDLSENPIIRLKESDFNKFEGLLQLYLEDMPLLEFIDRNAFSKIRSTIKIINLQNSRKLQQIDEFAFGMNANSNTNTTLRLFNLRGTSISTLNKTLSGVFRQLDELDLKGTPLLCDCNLNWLLGDFSKETEGVCSRPDNLKGHKISSLTINELKCDTNWPHWLYGTTILILMILCSCGLYFMVIHCRPHRNTVVMRQKISEDSPYAPITTIYSTES